MLLIEKATRTSNGGGIATGLATTISGERYWHHLRRGQPHEGPVFADRDRGRLAQDTGLYASLMGNKTRPRICADRPRCRRRQEDI